MRRRGQVVAALIGLPFFAASCATSGEAGGFAQGASRETMSFSALRSSVESVVTENGFITPYGGPSLPAGVSISRGETIHEVHIDSGRASASFIIGWDERGKTVAQLYGLCIDSAKGEFSRVVVAVKGEDGSAPGIDYIWVDSLSASSMDALHRRTINQSDFGDSDRTGLQYLRQIVCKGGQIGAPGD